MLEWAAISAAVLPHALEFAKGRAKSLAEKAADSALGDLYRRLVPDATLAAVNEAFFKRFCVELESSDFLTFTDDQTRHIWFSSFRTRPFRQRSKLHSMASLQSIHGYPLIFVGTLSPPVIRTRSCRRDFPTATCALSILSSLRLPKESGRTRA